MFNLNEINKQGKQLLKNRKHMSNNIKLSIIESMDSYDPNHERLSKISEGEIKELEDLKLEYDRVLSEYKTMYGNFILKYEIAQTAVNNCLAKCDEINNLEEKKSCRVGCELNKPYLIECEDNWGGNCEVGTKKDGSSLCNNGELTILGASVLGGDTIDLEASWYDKSGKSIEDGCCDCGGGLGGASVIKSEKGEKIESCDFYNNNPNLKSSCVQAPYKAFLKDGTKIKSRELWKEYAVIVSKNQKLMEIAKQLYDKVDNFKDININMNDNIKNYVDDLNREIGIFKANYDELQDISNKNNSMNITLGGFMEDIMLKKKSSELKYYMMSGLAISLIFMCMYVARK